MDENNENIADIDDLFDNTPPEIANIASSSKECLLPAKSGTIYLKTYETFKNWCSTKKVKKVSENVVLAYMTELSETKSGASLWSTYSMLKSTLLLKENVDIKQYNLVISFLKRKFEGHRPKKSNVFAKKDIERFLLEAEDINYLFIKVALILGVSGACRCDELVHLLMEHVVINQDVIIIRLPETKTKRPRSFTIVNPPNAQIDYLSLIRKYIQLRPKDLLTNGRFFLMYRNGKCTRQPVGVHKLATVSKTVATFLNLPEPERFTGHCLRRTSATILADSGADMTVLKRHGGWKSTSVAEGYLEDSLSNKNKIASRILSDDPQPSTSSGGVNVTNRVENKINNELITEEITYIIQENDTVQEIQQTVQQPVINISNNAHCSIIIYPRK